MSELTKRTAGGGVENGRGVEAAGIARKTKAKVQRLDGTESVIVGAKTLVTLFAILTFFVLLYFTHDKQNTFHYDQLDKNKIDHSVTTTILTRGH